MRKSTIVVILGSFIVITTLLCIGKENIVYKKEKYFNNYKEVLQQIEANELLLYNKKGYKQESKQFSECLSLRKRISGSKIQYSSINNIKEQYLTQDQKKDIEENYKKSIKKLKNYKERTSIEAVRFTGDVKNLTINNDSNHERKVIDMVFVDEGEGIVIDYFVDYLENHFNELHEVHNNDKN